MVQARRAYLALAFASVLGIGLPAQGVVASEVHVFVPDQAALLSLIALDLDLVPHEAAPGWVPVIVYGPAQLAALSQAGFQYQVVHADLVAHYVSGLATPVETSWPNGSMGGYYTFAEMIAAFDALVAAHPTLIAPKQSIGASHEGRPLWMWKISDNPLANESEPEALLDALHHAREPGGMMALYWFVKTILEGYATNPQYAALINQREIHVVPCVNPDGYVYNETTNPAGGGLWRKNRRNNGSSFGVDLNRNYAYLWGYDNVGSSPTASSETYRGPSPASEPEIQALVALGLAHSFTAVESVHTHGGFHLFPFGHLASAISPMAPAYLEWAGRMSVLSGYRAGTVPHILYTTNGSARDWWEGTLGVPAMTTEMGHENDGFWPPTSRILPISLDNFPTFWEMCWAAGTHVVVDSVVLHEVTGNANPWPEAGETFDVEVVLRNVGSQATAAAVPAAAQAATPYAQVIVGNASTPAALASRTNGSVTFRIVVAPSVPRAAPLSLLVSWTFDGVARQEEVRVTAGPLVSIATDTFEAASGWTVGSPADTGTGAWTRVNPNGTALALVAGGTTPWQSEDDHTAAAGTMCWVTGNGSVGGSVSAADLDGVTTLTSPAYDLGQVLLPEVSVWIWFANDDHDDALVVEASNDDGATWVQLETVLGWKNAWTQHTWRLNDWLLPTNKTRLRFRAQDFPNNSTTEAAIDDFEIRGYQPALTIGAVTTGQPIPFSLASAPALPGAAYAIGVSTSALAGIALGDGRVAGIDYTPALDLVFAYPALFVNFLGSLDGAGSASALLAISNPGLSGLKFFATAVTYQPAPFVPGELSGTLLITIP